MLTLVALLFMSNTWATVHSQHVQQSNDLNNTCQSNEIRCAKTATSAFAPNGDLWRLWVVGQTMFFQISQDRGASFFQPQRVAIPLEKISARNENRPKIAFDQNKGVYLSWAMPREKKYTADVRFSYSVDYGKTFSSPVTVNNDNLLAGHSFNELHVDANGNVGIVWLDGRLSYQLRKQGKQSKGSTLYLAQANPRKGLSSFSNIALANNTCVCCRIAMDETKQGKLAILWRHIYGDNIREFAMLTLNHHKQTEENLPKVLQISHDYWQINGCPHQGGGISIDEKNQYHLVWFNQGSKGKGIFYARSNDQGDSLSQPINVGNQTAQAVHPHVITSENKVTIVWMEFTGEEHQLWVKQSQDGGHRFGAAFAVASAKHGGDRPFLIKKGSVHLVSWLRFKQDHLLRVL